MPLTGRAKLPACKPRVTLVISELSNRLHCDGLFVSGVFCVAAVFVAKVHPHMFLTPLLLSSQSCVWFGTGLPCMMELSAGSDSFTCSSMVVGRVGLSRLVVFRMLSAQCRAG